MICWLADDGFQIGTIFNQLHTGKKPVERPQHQHAGLSLEPPFSLVTCLTSTPFSSMGSTTIKHQPPYLTYRASSAWSQANWCDHQIVNLKPQTAHTMNSAEMWKVAVTGQEAQFPMNSFRFRLALLSCLHGYLFACQPTHQLNHSKNHQKTATTKRPLLMSFTDTRRLALPPIHLWCPIPSPITLLQQADHGQYTHIWRLGTIKGR